MKEIFKRIDDYPNYEVSNFGNVRSIKSKKILKPFISNPGYLIVSLCNKGTVRKFPNHRLVAKAFLIPQNNDTIVNHKDGIKTNNKLDNLEWSTFAKNNKHSYDRGLNIPKYGENNFATKISSDIILEIKKLSKEGLSFNKISKLYNISAPYVGQIVKGKRRKYG